jgi:hypothetical protein
MKRLAIICMLVVLSLTAVIGCGSALATDNLNNAVGSGDGPGSGKWKPQKPTNQRQYRRLHEALTNVLDNSVKLGDQHIAMILNCYDKEGKRITDSDNPLCDREIRELEVELANHINDFRAGYGAFTTCDCSHLDTLKIDLPDQLAGHPFVVVEGLPKINAPMGVEDDEPAWWANSSCCLTCIKNFENPEYAFIDLDVDIAALATQ